MFHGCPRPLSADVSLSEFLALARPPRELGAWIRGSISRLHIHQAQPGARRRVLASPDLGFLLGRWAAVAVRDGERTIVAASETLIAWRALQVAMGTPYLPGLQRLQVLLPGLHCTPGGFLVPVGPGSPEEVLALCLEEGLRVTGSRIVYGPPRYLPPLRLPP
jgi:hypothetical protein